MNQHKNSLSVIQIKPLKQQSDATSQDLHVTMNFILRINFTGLNITKPSFLKHRKWRGVCFIYSNLSVLNKHLSREAAAREMRKTVQNLIQLIERFKLNRDFA